MNEIRLLLLNKGLVMEPYITFAQQIEKILKSLDGEVSSEITKAGNSNSTTTTELVDSIIKTGIEKRAKELGYDVSYISKWINSTMLPSAKNIKNIIKITGSNVIQSINKVHGKCPIPISNAFFKVVLIVFSKVLCNAIA